MTSRDDVERDTDDMTHLFQQLDVDEIRQIVAAAFRERFSEEHLYDVADDIVRGSELTDDLTKTLANDLELRVADRHQVGS